MVDRLSNATGVLGALKYLQSSTRDLNGTESRVSSGLKVAKARDDATSFHAAAIMKGQGSSLNAVTLSLGRAESISDTAIAAAEQVSKLLISMKETATQAMAEDLTTEQRGDLSQRYSDQMNQLQTFIHSASFDESNILDGSKPNGVSFIADADASQTLVLQGRNFLPGGSIITAPPSTSALSNPQAASDAQRMISESIDNVGDQLIEMSDERKRIESQKGFVSKLADALAAGVSRMVDTDLATESALIQALQVKQELSAQSVGIANAAPDALLQLFR